MNTKVKMPASTIAYVEATIAYMGRGWLCTTELSYMLRDTAVLIPALQCYALGTLESVRTALQWVTRCRAQDQAAHVVG